MLPVIPTKSFFQEYLKFIWQFTVIPIIFAPMISRRTKKKVLQGKYVKLNPDAIVEIKKQVKKGNFPSENNAINVAVEEKFIPKK